MTADALLSLPVATVPLTFLDVETTGLSAAYGDRICEVAAVQVLGGAETDRIVSLVDPGRPIGPEASRVNGITDAMVVGAPRFADLLARVRSLVETSIVVAHNARFDLSFLEDEYRRAGLIAPRLIAVDTCALARGCFRFGSNSLPSIAARLGIRAGGHRALGDVEAMRAIFDWMVARLGGANALSVADLLARQGGRAAPAGLVSAPIDTQLRELIERGVPFRMRYWSSSGVAWRVVQPGRVYADGRAWYLEAFCHLRQEQRTFRLDRIMAWETADNT